MKLAEVRAGRAQVPFSALIYLVCCPFSDSQTAFYPFGIVYLGTIMSRQLIGQVLVKPSYDYFTISHRCFELSWLNSALIST